MKTDQIIERIKAILSDLEKIDGEGSLPEIERDILLEQLRAIYGDIKCLKDEPEVKSVEIEESVAFDFSDADIEEEFEDEDDYDLEEEDYVAEEEDGYILFGTEISDEQKRLFIKELFNDDEDYFNREMEKLHSKQHLDSLLFYISEAYQWRADSKEAEDFIALALEYDFKGSE